jgi:hypothetical protein
MPPGEKMERAFEWSEIVRGFAEAGLRQRHPNADDREILLRYARMTLGEELFRRAYGDVTLDDTPRKDAQDAG